MSEFFLRVALPVADAPCVSIVTLTFEPPTPGATVLNLIFDNEAAYGFNSLNVDTEAIWSKLAELRDLKNKVFDASLTEKAKELFRQSMLSFAPIGFCMGARSPRIPCGSQPSQSLRRGALRLGSATNRAFCPVVNVTFFSVFIPLLPTVFPWSIGS